MKGAVFTSFIICGLCNCVFAVDSFNQDEINIHENEIINSDTNSILINKQDMYIINNGTINE